MRKIALPLLVISMLTLEIGLLGFPLRTDISVFLTSMVMNPAIAFLSVSTILLLALAYGKSGLVSGILILSPFISISFGKILRSINERSLIYLLYFCFSVVLIQRLTGHQFFGFLYNSHGVSNILAPAGFSSEPSFFFEFLFFLICLIYIIGRNDRLFISNLFAYIFISIFTNTLTGIQNVIVLSSFSLICLLGISKGFYFKYFLIFPLFFVYIFGDFSYEIGKLFLKNFSSWRQLGNISAIYSSSFFYFGIHDYRSLVAEDLLSKGLYELYYWIESAFSWIPFLHSVLGRFFSIIIALIFILLNRFSYVGNYRVRIISYTATILFFYISPKWQMFYPMLIWACTYTEIRERKMRASSTALRAPFEPQPESKF